MPRKPRFFLPGVPAHVVQRGNNRQPIFFDERDYRAYLGWLQDAAQRASCQVHAYVLMTNHVHLLLTPAESDGISRTIQDLGRRFVPYINDNYRRSGTLWEGRFKASLVQTDAYLLACSTYIELNPVRARMVAHPGQYPWSSYAFNAHGEPNPLLTTHPELLRLGANAPARHAAYRALFAQAPGAEALKDIRDCVQTGTPLGNDRFRAHIEATLGTRVGRMRRGRPKRPADAPPATSTATDQITLAGL